MAPELMTAWLLSIFVAVAPPGRDKPVEAIETAEEGRARYTEIARAIADTVQAEPLLFAGERAIERTALVMASVAYLESGLRKDVDLGLKKGPAGDCGLWQFNLGTHGKTLEGYSCDDVTKDRHKAAKSALAMMRRSFRACARFGHNAMLRVYASGSCQRGLRESRVRMQLAGAWEGRFGWPKPSD